MANSETSFCWEQARAELQDRLANTEQGPVKQDLRIMVDYAQQELEGIRLEEEHLLPYVDVAQIIYAGIWNLLKDRIPPKRRRAALTRLKRYTGQAEGYEPLAALAEDISAESGPTPAGCRPFEERSSAV